ncbi:MAG: ISL3 family transposase [Zhaonellaceae bacterium]
MNYKYHRCFKKLMREIDIINYLLDLDPELKASYKLYQYVRLSIKNKDFYLLEKVLDEFENNVSDYMKTSIKTAKRYIGYIENTFKYDYTNGVLEGINNKIKIIKRIAFGYRCFFHLKNRILITQNLVRLKMA